MAKETTEAAAAADAPAAEAPVADVAPAVAVDGDDRDYATAVVRKQLQLPADKAAAKVKSLGGQAVAELAAAGRAGDLDRVRALLGT